MCPWIVSNNLQEGFIQIHNVLSVRSSFSVLFTFAILIAYIIKCASIVAVLVRRRHHLVIFFIVVVVGHLELREISTSRFGLSSSIYAICDDCGLTEFLGTGEHNSLDNGPRTVQGKDVNRRVVYAASEIGDWQVIFQALPKNANESVNSLVWVRCPTHKWHGKGWVSCWGSHQKGKQQKRLWAN